MQPPWNAEDLKFDPTDFSGTARIFPLPDLVLFPHVMQPLHVFEDRYREMLSAALRTDRLIAMATLEPGWEVDYATRPPVAPMACLGKVVAHHQFPDGRANLLLLGVARIRIVEELPPLRSFREARVELVSDKCGAASGGEPAGLHRALMDAFQEHIACGCQIPEQLNEFVSEHISLAALTDLAAYALPLSDAIKLQLLAERCVESRAELLLRELREMRTAQEELLVDEEDELSDSSTLVYPPSFSRN